jgi:23S rRNA G2069 N7-methylase RlmK/C1962 C5-methylase RlmI
MKTPLRKYTFENRRIREWLERKVEGKVLNLFAGKTLLNCHEVRNDLREEMPADYHMDALKRVKTWMGDPFDTIILDPPYAYRKSMEMYGGAVSSPFNQIKNFISNILTLEGIVITFGYHSNVMGEKRGFTQEHILLMSHGGAIHDTIAIIERKKKDMIDTFFSKNT